MMSVLFPGSSLTSRGGFPAGLTFDEFDSEEAVFGHLFVFISGQPRRDFDAPNHVELGSPNVGWGSSNMAAQATFGQIISTKASMRQIQFTLKYNF